VTKLKITIEWSPHLQSYSCKIDAFGDVKFQGHSGDDLAMNVGSYIKQWVAHDSSKREMQKR